MMFPTGTGRRKSDLLPHRAQAVALIWKMISVLLQPINIILVSPVNDTFLPSIADLTEEEMSVTREWGGVEKGGRGGGILEGRWCTPGGVWGGVGESFTPLTAVLTSSHPLRHSHRLAETHSLRAR